MKTHKPTSAAALVQKDSRKLTHVLAGPGFVMTWPLFRWVSAIVTILPQCALQAQRS